jgi:phosphatidate phosphatase APP1
MTRRSRPLTNLAEDDRVVLFPSLGYLASDEKHWLVTVHGEVSGPGRMTLGKRVMLRILKRAMRASKEALASPLFLQRIARFVSRSRSGRRIAVQIGERTYALPDETSRNGHFQAAVRVPVEERRSGHLQLDPEYLPLEVCGPDHQTVARGVACLLPPTGVSVISDIDDTIKHSQVACKRTLLMNTFLRPFETVPGMVSLFREWADRGAAFHYVSSSPWQLYEHLAEHLAMEGFPAGSFHLRSISPAGHLIRRLLLVRRTGKAAMVRTLLNMFPQRRFVLVGDSGEHDPEIYGAIARRFPQQVAGIFIRRLGGPSSKRRRFASAFEGVDSSIVRLFRHAWEVADDPCFENAIQVARP